MNNDWEKNRGTISFLESQINSPSLSIKSEDILFLISIINTNKHIILIIDDVLLNIKILCLKLIKCINPLFNYKNFPVITINEWRNHKIIHIEVDNHIFILTSNGLYGKEITIFLQNQNITIITDIEMPLLNGIDMIKSLFKKNIKAKIYINSAKYYNDDEEINELIKNNQIVYLEKGVYKDYDKILDKTL
jgi:CheY-like chemotaxis protein